MDDLRMLLYYLPGLKAGAEVKGKVASVLGAAVNGCDLHIGNTDAGPGGVPGVIVAAVPEHRPAVAGAAAKRLKYCADPARQVWIEGDGYWVGYDADARPAAADLERRSMVSGYPHTCPESGAWVVPLARYVDGGTSFDERIVYLPGGAIEMRPLARYERLCSFAAEHFEWLSSLETDDGNLTVRSVESYAEVAVEALGINYHVGRFELSLLGTITRESAVLICGYLCDWPGLCRLMAARGVGEKKTGSTGAGSTTNSGEPAA